jgi:hypothetical protein
MTNQTDFATAAAKARGPVGATPGFSYLDWPAIFAGTFIALAISMLMLTFGSALGLSMVSVEPGEGMSLRWATIVGGIWFIWVVLSSVGAGAYLAGRLRHPIGDAVDDEVELRDGSQGLVVWAVSVVIATMLAANGVAGLAGAAAQTAGAVGSGIADMAEEPLGNVATSLVRDPTGTQGVSEGLQTEAAGILTRSVMAGGITDEDRQYLVARVAAETGQSPAQVQARVDEAANNAQAAWQQAQEAIEDARRAAVITGFAIAATLLAVGAVGYVAAVKGGTHRDENIPLRSLRR